MTAVGGKRGEAENVTRKETVFVAGEEGEGKAKSEPERGSVHGRHLTAELINARNVSHKAPGGA